MKLQVRRSKVSLEVVIQQSPAVGEGYPGRAIGVAATQSPGRAGQGPAMTERSQLHQLQPSRWPSKYLCRNITERNDLFLAFSRTWIVINSRTSNNIFATTQLPLFAAKYVGAGWLKIWDGALERNTSTSLASITLLLSTCTNPSAVRDSCLVSLSAIQTCICAHRRAAT